MATSSDDGLTTAYEAGDAVAHRDAVTEFWTPQPTKRERRPEKFLARQGRRVVAFVGFLGKMFADVFPAIIVGLLIFTLSSFASYGSAIFGLGIRFNLANVGFDAVAFLLTYALLTTLVGYSKLLLRVHNQDDRKRAWRSAFQFRDYEVIRGMRPHLNQIHFGYFRLQCRYNDERIRIRSSNDWVSVDIATGLISGIYEFERNENQIDTDDDDWLQWNGWMQKDGLRPLAIMFDDGDSESFFLIHGTAFASLAKRRAFIDGLRHIREQRST